MTGLALLSSTPSLIALPLIGDAPQRTQTRFLEFFAANIRNPNTRRAYARAAGDLLDWCAARGVRDLAGITPIHVAGWIEQLGATLSAPTVKLRLAAIRNLFDWLVVGQAVPFNPASSVRGPAHSARTGRTPVLQADEARALIDAIDT